jgi:hypothetical protein
MADTSGLRSNETWDGYVKRAGGRAATLSELDDVLEVVVDTLGGELKAAKARIAELEARVQRAEDGGIKAAPAVRWRGHWKNATRYDEGELVTHGGSLWLAMRTATDRPGTADSGFKLVVKRGSYQEQD